MEDMSGTTQSPFHLTTIFRSPVPLVPDRRLPQVSPPSPYLLPPTAGATLAGSG